MKVVVTTIGKFHSFDMARQLEKRDALVDIFSGYPKFRLRDEGLPADKIHSWPYFQSAYMLLVRHLAPNTSVVRNLGWLSCESIDKHVARNLPPCDAFVGLSNSGLHTGRVAKSRGAVYVCDRGSAHIAVQSEIMTKEFRNYGIKYAGTDPRLIEKEEAEYQLADLIFVPSKFAVSTFLERGIPESKLAYAPYGVDLARFSPVAEPSAGRFDVLYVGDISVRKGIRYLLSAFRNVNHPQKSLTLIGPVGAGIRSFLEKEIADLPVELKGVIPNGALKEHMSRAHVFVLPSVEDGFGLVMSEAMACACPVIASDQTGGPDLITQGVDGYVFPSGDTEALTHYMQMIADDPDLRASLSRNALKRVIALGGWDEYGESIYRHLCALMPYTEAK